MPSAIARPWLYLRSSDEPLLRPPLPSEPRPYLSTGNPPHARWGIPLPLDHRFQPWLLRQNIRPAAESSCHRDPVSAPPGLGRRVSSVSSRWAEPPQPLGVAQETQPPPEHRVLHTLAAVARDRFELPNPIDRDYQVQLVLLAPNKRSSKLHVQLPGDRLRNRPGQHGEIE